MNARNFATVVGLLTTGLVGCGGAEVKDQGTSEKPPIQCPERTHFAEGLLTPHDPESTAWGCLNDRWKTVEDLRGGCSTKVLQVMKDGSWRCGYFPRRR